MVVGGGEVLRPGQMELQVDMSIQLAFLFGQCLPALASTCVRCG